jgi:putative membrane protein
MISREEWNIINRIKRTILRAGLVLCLVALPMLAASAQVPGNRPMNGGNGSMQPGTQGGPDMAPDMQSMADHDFLKDAGEGGLAEVQLGQLATEKASAANVKEFAQRMVDDHTKANDELKQIASRKGIALSSTLSSKDRKTKERLAKLSGADFDRAYMKLMVKDHEKDVSDFRTESTSGQDPVIRKFAAQTLPTLQAHLKEAQSIAPNGVLSQNTNP